jgi:hypothetical protein
MFTLNITTTIIIIITITITITTTIPPEPQSLAAPLDPGLGYWHALLHRYRATPDPLLCNTISVTL